MTGFTGVLADIADLCGEAVALKIQGAFGGRVMIVPVDPAKTPRAQLCALIGVDASAKIQTTLGSGRFEIPIGALSSERQLRRANARRIAELDESGASLATIARTVDVTMRTAANHRSRRRGDRNQTSLFDGL